MTVQNVFVSFVEIQQVDFIMEWLLVKLVKHSLNELSKVGYYYFFVFKKGGQECVYKHVGFLFVKKPDMTDMMSAYLFTL